LDGHISGFGNKQHWGRVDKVGNMIAMMRHEESWNKGGHLHSHEVDRVLPRPLN
jgi:hypothetical protein